MIVQVRTQPPPTRYPYRVSKAWTIVKKTKQFPKKQGHTLMFTGVYCCRCRLFRYEHNLATDPFHTVHIAHQTHQTCANEMVAIKTTLTLNGLYTIQQENIDPKRWRPLCGYFYSFSLMLRRCQIQSSVNSQAP